MLRAGNAGSNTADVRDIAAVDAGVAELDRLDIVVANAESAGTAFQTLNAVQIPLVEPIDVSNATAFIVSDEARFVTGIQFPVDAGCINIQRDEPSAYPHHSRG